jgi:hypothetical protein
MNWALAIERNRTALLAIVSAIVALIGGRDARGPVLRAVRNAALALLRPAESACRRLIVIAARGLVVKPAPARPFTRPVTAAGHTPAASNRAPAFRLTDRAKRYRPVFVPQTPVAVPRIRSLWRSPFERPAPPPPPPTRPAPSTHVEDTRLARRLAALEGALANLPRQARRLARWRARQSAQHAALRQPSPLRIGAPPGHRLTRPRAIDAVLEECNLLAHEALRFNTSRSPPVDPSERGERDR